MYHGELYPGLAALRGFLVVLAEAPELHQPSEGALDHPAAGKRDKALVLLGTLDDLKQPACTPGSPGNKFARVAGVRPDKAKTGESSPELAQDQLGTVSVLHPSTVHNHRQQQPQRIYRQVALAPFDPLPRIEAVVPPFCVVFTDWVSMIAAEGVGLRPLCTRTFSRKAS